MRLVPVNLSKTGASGNGPCARLAVFFCLVAILLPALAQPIIADTIEQRTIACTQCHGKQGQGTDSAYIPRLAGKPAGYLYNQLVNFREGRRLNQSMTYMVDHQSDAYLMEIARYFSDLRVPYAAPQRISLSGRQMERGRQLVSAGDPAKNVPACTACHGKNLTGYAPAVPALVGLPHDYLNAQFGNWLNHTRHAAPPDCMADILARLTRSDISAVSAWLAAQPVPRNSEPVLALPDRMPVQCGSVPGIEPHAAGQSVVAGTMNAQLVRGAYLVKIGDCMGCHTARGGKPYAGARAIPTAFGTMLSPNLTADKATGLGLWTSDDFWQAMHNGIARDGSYLYPVFPFPSYTRVTREDSDAIFSYLKSLTPVTQTVRQQQLRFPYNQRWLLAVWRMLYFRPGVYQSDQTQSLQWNRGAYLTQGLGHCSSCHTPHNALGAEIAHADLAGGLIPVLHWYAPALTSDAESGLGLWSSRHIADLLKSGVSEKGTVFGPMAEVVARSLQYLSDTDIDAMALYLKSVPKTGNAETNTAAAARPEFEGMLLLGAKVYEKRCADCHQSNGQGVGSAYPALAGNHTLTMPSAVNAIRIILNGGYGPGTAGNPRPYGMPPFANVLSDAELLAVVNYVRNSWGNHASPVEPGEINRDRGIPYD